MKNYKNPEEYKIGQIVYYVPSFYLKDNNLDVSEKGIVVKTDHKYVYIKFFYKNSEDVKPVVRIVHPQNLFII